MSKLVVLFAVLAVASAKPNLLSSGLIGGWGSPLAVSRQSVVSVAPGLVGGWNGVVSSPLISSPLVSSLGVSAYSAVPAVSSGLVGGWNNGWNAGWNGLASPLISSIGEPALIPGSPAGVLKSNGQLVDTSDVVVARNNHLVARNLAAHGIQKRSIISPLAYNTGLISPISSLGLSTPLVSSLGVSAYSAIPAVSSGLVGGWNNGWNNGWNGLATPLVSSLGEPALIPGSPAGVVKATGKLVDTADVVVARNNHRVATTLAIHGIQKRSAISPLAYSTGLVSPIAPLGLSSPIISSSIVSPWASSNIVSPWASRSIVSPIGVSHLGGVVSPIGVHGW